MVIFTEVTENECIIEMHLCDIDLLCHYHCEDWLVLISVVYMPYVAETPSK